MLLLGALAVFVVALGLLLVVRLAGAQERRDQAPPSQPSDFVAPVSSGGYRWRAVDESPADFRARVDRENEASPDSKS